MHDKSSFMIDQVKKWTRNIATAGSFLSRLPFRPSGDIQAEDLSSAVGAFPLIGLLIGGLCGSALWVADWAGLQPLACAFIGLLACVWITGALHEDGLADLADGLGGTNRDRRLAIMRDSRIGSFGVLALILTVGLKAAILAQLSEEGLGWSAMIVAAALSRSVMAPCMVLIPPARTDGLAYSAGRPDASGTAQALIFGAAISIAFFGWGPSIVILAGALLAMAIIAWLARSQLGGYTGDVLGAVQQTADVFILVVIGAMLP